MGVSWEGSIYYALFDKLNGGFLGGFGDILWVHRDNFRDKKGGRVGVLYMAFTENGIRRLFQNRNLFFVFIVFYKNIYPRSKEIHI